MYGGGTSSKLRRAAPKLRHSSFPPTPPHHPRLFTSGVSFGRNTPRVTAAEAAADPPLVEETFNLVSGSNLLAYSMIIRLAPDLVEEIKRVEAQGGRTRVKFDSNPYNSGGNVIDVGGKQFRFTWSLEFGDLCDIYEERQSGEDGNGLLVESGCAWRKLNVQRILDESTKNHVKMRSEEAERKLKSRKAIVLEPGNPSMRRQIRALAAVEATMWKNCNKKKEAAPNKRKVETLQVGGPPKSTYKPGSSLTTAAEGRHSFPLASPPYQSAASSSPLGAVNMSKSIDDAVPSQMIGKQDMNAGSEKEIPTRTNNAMRNTIEGKGNNIAKPIDLQSMLISLLMNKPNGLTLKALEKAVQDIVPNSIKKIEPIVRKIAMYKSPGRYILLPGVDLESFKKPQTESRSSSDDNHHQLPAHQEFHDQTPAPLEGLKEKVPNDNLEELVQSNSKVEEESNTLEKINDQHASPDIFGERKGSDHKEGQGGSSSDSGSDNDSESDSSDSSSDSGSHSRSRSRSPAGTGSGGSSGSECDASSNSKAGSDQDVDIMTSDDEKEPKYKTDAADQRVSSPIPVKSPDGRCLQYEIHEKQDGNESDAVEIQKNLPEEQEAEIALTTATISNKGGKAAKDMHFSPDYKHLEERQNYIGSLFDERENGVKDSSRNEKSDNYERLSNCKHKRDAVVKNIDEKAERIKRWKAENLGQARGSSGMGVQTFDSTHSFCPVGFTEDSFKDLNVQVVNGGHRQENSNVGLQKGYNQAFLGKYTSDLTQTGQRSLDQTLLGKPSIPLEKSDKQGESLGHSRKHSEKDLHVGEGSSLQKDKSDREAKNEDIHPTEKKVSRNSRDVSNGSKQSLSMETVCLKQGEMVGKLKEGQQGTRSHIGTLSKDNNRVGLDNSPIINRRGVSPQRELSNLKLGELRESTLDNHVAKQFERKNSSEHLENRANALEEGNPDVVKPPLNATSESRKLSPAFVSSGFLSNLESTNKKNSDDHFEDSTRSHARIMQSHPQHLNAVNVDIGSQNKLAEMNGIFRINESGMSQGTDLESHSESNRRAPANAFKQHDTKHGTVPYPVKESKRQTPNSLEEVADRGNNSAFADKNNSDQRRRESSSDENSCPYLKYEKDEPELKGPIRTFSQYKEYVQEFHEKYDIYSSLNKSLASYRNEFYELGKDLEYTKDRDVDRYYNILGQLKESYQRYGMEHKRQKKVYVVLHLELERLKQRITEFVDSYNNKK